jgi:antiviral helicase SKI2
MVIVCNKPYPQDQEDVYDEHFKLFPFPLSDFQKYSIQALVDGNHTLVTAATGNGKTISADFAIQHFVRGKGKKLIYTCPIKSLSNQKFHDFSEKYPDIQFGIFTGDIKFNPTADVIFATAEILMNHLFAMKEVEDGAQNKQLHFQIDIQTELACVVMDECHFILDEDRGYVWENTILMLPPHIQMVLLSATLDQPEKFARFCERNGLGSKQVVWSSTLTRIVPLTHYGFVTTTESIFKKVKDKETQALIRNSSNKLIPLKTDKGEFKEQGYKEIQTVKTLLEKNDVFISRQHVLNNLAKFLVEKEMLPALCFSFSRKTVETLAKEITTNVLEFDSKVPYTIQREAEQILRSKLSNYQEYLQMPEYVSLIQLLEKGIGIHHSGMIPILREIVEFMISKKYIKILFATDSFSIGLNCEIKTVIFTTLQKFDGNLTEYLQPHAYTQMAGRAGRRNIDVVGHVIHCNNLFPLPYTVDYRTILCGRPQKMESKFHVSYGMVLNLIRNGTTTVQGFTEFARNSLLMMDLQDTAAQLQKEKRETEENLEKANSMVIPYLKTPLEIMEKYMTYKSQLPTLVNKKRKEVERNIQTIMDEYKSCIADTERYKSVHDLQDNARRINKDISNLESYMDTNVVQICEVLVEHGFIERVVDEEFHFTAKGHVSAQIGEIHPLVATEIFFQYDWLEKMDPIQIVVLLSCFTDVRVNQDVIKYNPTIDDPLICNVCEYMKLRLVVFEEEEGRRGLQTGFRYQNAIVYDLMEEMIQWMNCQSEEECKMVLQEITETKQITVGDFVKAVLKISAVAKEWISLCDYEGKVALMSKLQQIDGLILKYVCTTQSLYV